MSLVYNLQDTEERSYFWIGLDFSYTGAIDRLSFIQLRFPKINESNGYEKFNWLIGLYWSNGLKVQKDWNKKWHTLSYTYHRYVYILYDNRKQLMSYHPNRFGQLNVQIKVLVPILIRKSIIHVSKRKQNKRKLHKLLFRWCEAFYSSTFLSTNGKKALSIVENVEIPCL